MFAIVFYNRLKDNLNHKDVLLEIEEVTKILFIIDSDYETEQKFGGYENTLKEIEIIQKKLNIKDISDTFIAYDKNLQNKEGYLESLILSSSQTNKMIVSKVF
jgi:hypothetical protein